MLEYTFRITNTLGETCLEVDGNGELSYRFKGELKKVEEREEILEAFRYCILGMNDGKSHHDVLFDKFLQKIDYGKLTNKQITEIEKRIRKLKLKKLL